MLPISSWSTREDILASTTNRGNTERSSRLRGTREEEENKGITINLKVTKWTWSLFEIREINLILD